jgi:serine/threonine protein kinase
VLLDADGHIRLTDFGLAKEMTDVSNGIFRMFLCLKILKRPLATFRKMILQVLCAEPMVRW